MEIAIITTGVGLLIFLSYLFSHIFREFNIPDVLFLVVIGLILGPITGLVEVEQAGVVGEFFVIITLLIILFEVGLNIKFTELIKTAPRALLLMLVVLASSTAVVATIAHYILEIPVVESIIIGVLLGGVSSALAVPLIQKLPVSDKTRSLLTIEANMSDILIIALVFAILDFSNGGTFDIKTFSTSLGVSTLISILVGSFTALIWSQIIAKMRNIQNNIFMTPALVLMVFGVSELLGASGVFAAFAFGITLGNLQFIGSRGFPAMFGFHEFSLTKWETRMFSGLVFILKTYFFVYIGLSIGFDNTVALISGFAVAILLFLVRAGAIKLIIRDSISLLDREILSRLFPKGLVGAALITLISNQIARDFTYSVILFSIILTSILIFILKPKQLAQQNSINDPDTDANNQPSPTNNPNS